MCDISQTHVQVLSCLSLSANFYVHYVHLCEAVSPVLSLFKALCLIPCSLPNNVGFAFPAMLAALVQYFH